MKTHNSQKYGHKRKRPYRFEHERDMKMRSNTRGYLTMLGVLLAAMVVTAFLSPKAQSATMLSPIIIDMVLDDDPKTDSCGRVLDSGGVPTAHNVHGEYISPEKCHQIRERAEKERKWAEQDRLNFILSIIVAVFATVIGIALAKTS